MQISFDGSYANNLQKFLCKTCFFPKILKLSNLSKQRFSLLQEKVVIYAVCLRTDLDSKGGLWVFWKSQKISTASDQYFFSYVKKTTVWGGSPAGMGLIHS